MKPEHKQYLDNLGKSGVINMFGATPYLIEAFPELSKNEARDIVLDWMGLDWMEQFKG